MPSEDRGEFIRDFWARRDPDPTTQVNEFRETYYQRMAIADKAFKRGKPGWMTDRGRAYILLGPPTNVITKTMGDSAYEQNKFVKANTLETGTLTERPTEIWVYDNYPDYFEGPLRLVFVDYYSTGDFKLTTNETITAFSMFSPQWDPPDLAKFQWVGELEMDEVNFGEVAIFDYDASAEVKGEGSLRSAVVYMDIPFFRLDYREQEKKYTCSLDIAVEIRDNRKQVLTTQNEAFSRTFSLEEIRSNIANKIQNHKEWELDLPPTAQYIYVSVTDTVKQKRLRKLLTIGNSVTP
jgi:GWxTD domain-containing protein